MSVSRYGDESCRLVQERGHACQRKVVAGEEGLRFAGVRVVAGVFYATREASVEKHMSNSPEHYRHPRTPGRFDENRTLACE